MPIINIKLADSAAIKADYEGYEGKIVKVAGRLMSKRGQGKVMFCDLQDSTGRIQLFVKIDEMGEEEYGRFKKNDIGDIVGAEGEVFKTKTGEISIRTKSIILLSKSLLPFCPESPRFLLINRNEENRAKSGTVGPAPPRPRPRPPPRAEPPPPSLRPPQC